MAEAQDNSEMLIRTMMRKMMNRDALDRLIADIIDTSREQPGQADSSTILSREEMIEELKPKYEAYHDMSLALDQLHDLRALDTLECYRSFAANAPYLIVRDMALSATQGTLRSDEKKKHAATLLDYCMKTHLEIAVTTLQFLGRPGFEGDPEAENLKKMFVKSRRIFVERYNGCKLAGILTKENTKDNIVDPKVFEVEATREK